MTPKRIIAAVAIVAASGLLALSASPSGAESTDSGSVTPPGATEELSLKTANTSSTVDKHVWHEAPSYWGGSGGPTGGVLGAGWNYFYCQGQGMDYSFDGHSNNWWLFTDDDSGNDGVWVSAVYLSEGGDWEPIPGVPYC